MRILSSSSSSNCVKSLKINGLYNLRKEHLQTLHLYLPKNQIVDHHPNFLHEHRRRLNTASQHKMTTIDVEVCPRCDQVRMVFSCPKETCIIRTRNSTRRENGCRGCEICIPRCVECGGCVDPDDEEESAVCGDSLCLDCWLQLPKCNFCNRPYCNQHYSSYQQLVNNTEEEGFVCSSCMYDNLDHIVMDSK